MNWRKNKFENNKSAVKYRNEINAYNRKHGSNLHSTKSAHLLKTQKEFSETKTEIQGTHLE